MNKRFPIGTLVQHHPDHYMLIKDRYAIGKIVETDDPIRTSVDWGYKNTHPTLHYEFHLVAYAPPQPTAPPLRFREKSREMVASLMKRLEAPSAAA